MTRTGAVSYRRRDHPRSFPNWRLSSFRLRYLTSQRALANQIVGCSGVSDRSVQFAHENRLSANLCRRVYAALTDIIRGGDSKMVVRFVDCCNDNAGSQILTEVLRKPAHHDFRRHPDRCECQQEDRQTSRHKNAGSILEPATNS